MGDVVGTIRVGREATARGAISVGGKTSVRGAAGVESILWEVQANVGGASTAGGADDGLRCGEYQEPSVAAETT